MGAVLSSAENCIGSNSGVPANIKTEIQAVETKGILTLSKPGQWAGREKNHVPRLEVKDGHVTVSSGHRMESDHWIDYIYARDDKGALIGAVKLAYTDAPSATFRVPAGTKTVTGYNSCKLHGAWATDSTPV